MILHLVLISLACWIVDSAEPCFPDAVPATSRRSIVDVGGTPIPIRIGSFAWNLAVQLSVLLDLIISEKLGYDTAPVELLGFPSFQDLVLKLAGCATAACNETADAVHIIVDAFPGVPRSSNIPSLSYVPSFCQGDILWPKKRNPKGLLSTQTMQLWVPCTRACDALRVLVGCFLFVPVCVRVARPYGALLHPEHRGAKYSPKETLV